METTQIDILNPKTESDFSVLVKKIKAKSEDKISLEDITKEVEGVRKFRYEN